MRQLLLDLGTQTPQTLDTFAAGRNSELLHQLRLVLKRASQERFAYLWGEPASGKTHLLRALSEDPASRFICADAEPHMFTWSPDTTLYLLDDCNRLPAASQILAFTLFNAIRDHGGFMVSTGNAPPASLPVRDDLRSRLAWGLSYPVHRLTDDEKIAVLSQAAHARGFTISPAVLTYLITHYQRDMRSLSAMLDALDRYSLETRRAITLPLLRELLELDSSA